MEAEMEWTKRGLELRETELDEGRTELEEEND